MRIVIIVERRAWCRDAHKACGVGHHVLADAPVLSRGRKDGAGRRVIPWGWLMRCPVKQTGWRRGGYHGEEIVEATVEECSGVWIRGERIVVVGGVAGAGGHDGRDGRRTKSGWDL